MERIRQRAGLVLLGLGAITSLAACNRQLTNTAAANGGTAEATRLEAEAGTSSQRLASAQSLPAQNVVKAQSAVDPSWSGGGYTWTEYDSAASGGQAVGLATNWAQVTFTVPGNFTGGQYQVKLQAKGILYNGAPKVAFKLNGNQVSEKEIWNTGYGNNDYGSYQLKAGDSLQFMFTNDAYGGAWNQDRNVIIDFIDLQALATSQSTSPAPSSGGNIGTIGGYNLWGNKYVGPNEYYKSIQAAINAAGWGETIVVKAGTYREKIYLNKGIKLLGEVGAIVKGSDVWGGFWREGNYWVKNYDKWFQNGGQCKGGTNWRCQKPDQVFVNGEPQFQETSLGNVGWGDFYVGNGKVYLGTDPYNKTVEVSTRDAWLVGQGPSDVTIKGIRFQHAATPAQVAGLQANGPRWTIEGNEIAFAHGTGLAMNGDSTVARGNYVHHNGQNGITGSSWNMRVENNKIFNNNTEEFDSDWEGGGTKWSRAGNLTITGNEAYNNDGAGLWCDIDCKNVTFSNNRVYNNQRQGIHYEISDGCTITGNVAYKNGLGLKTWPLGSGILIQNSDNCQVYGNTLAWNADGIGIIQGSRGGYTLTQNNYIHDNVIAGNEGSLVGIVSNADGSVFQGWTNNRAYNNRFYQTGSASWGFNYQDLWSMAAANNTYAGGGSWTISKGELDGVLNSKGAPLWP